MLWENSIGLCEHDILACPITKNRKTKVEKTKNFRHIIMGDYDILVAR